MVLREERQPYGLPSNCHATTIHGVTMFSSRPARVSRSIFIVALAVAALLLLVACVLGALQETELSPGRPVVLGVDGPALHVP